MSANRPAPPDSFAELVRRVQSRDESAASELVRRFEPELRRVVRFQLTDPGLRRFLDSLDVCQSVLGAFFARMYAGTLRLDTAGQVAGLLALMARHKVIDRARQYRAARGALGVADAAAAESAPDPRPSPEQHCANRELLEAVRGGLAGEDLLILDGWLGGRGWAELASEMGGTPEGLRKRLGRAIDAVAVRLGLVEGAG